eukprot:7488781-Alexandrium_andersonii.AAC.1
MTVRTHDVDPRPTCAGPTQVQTARHCPANAPSVCHCLWQLGPPRGGPGSASAVLSSACLFLGGIQRSRAASRRP